MQISDGVRIVAFPTRTKHSPSLLDTSPSSERHLQMRYQYLSRKRKNTLHLYLIVFDPKLRFLTTSSFHDSFLSHFHVTKICRNIRLVRTIVVISPRSSLMQCKRRERTMRDCICMTDSLFLLYLLLRFALLFFIHQL